MIINSEDVKALFLCNKRVDFRRQIDGLVSYIIHEFNRDVLDKSLFVFVSGDHKKLKMIYYDGSGFWLLTKRMEKGKFKMKFGSESMLNSLTKNQLSYLLEGLDYESKNIDKIKEKSYLL